MLDQNENKRLVAIGIRRKGDKGFKKSFDPKVKFDNIFIDPETLPVPHAAVSNASQILNLLPE